MSKELIVSSTLHETKVAILEDDQVAEVYFEREQEYSLAGSIYKGRVTRVLPGMQSAFVNIGLERDAFLYVSDFFEDTDEYDALVTATEEKVARMERDGQLAPGGAPVVLSAGAVAGPAFTDAETAPSVPPTALAPVVEMPAPANAEGPAQPPAKDGGRFDRDRHHRRNRRRRGKNRGGFPESKYAGNRPPQSAPPSVTGSTEEAAPDASSAEEAAVEEATSHEAEEIPYVLPGESLAKYRGRAAAEEETAEEEASEQQSSDDAPEHVEEVHAAPVHEESVSEIAPDLLTEAKAVEPVTATIAPVVTEPTPEPVADDVIPPAHAAEPAHEAFAAEPATSEGQATAPESVEASPVEESMAEEAVVEVVEEEIVAEEAGPAEQFAAGESIGDEEGLSEEEAEATAACEEQPDGEQAPTDAVATVRGPAPERRFQSRRQRRRQHRDQRSDQRGERGPNQHQQRGTAAQPQGQHAQGHQHQHSGDSRPHRGQPLIGELLREGQEIIVQIAKEPIGKKGARITSHIALPGRYLVYMPTVDHVGVSRRISSDEERQRLKRVLSDYRRSVNMPGGFIVRTAAEGHSEEDLRADMRFLFNLWKDCRAQAERKSAPLLLHRDLNLVERILRDQVSNNFSTIWVDDETQYAKIVEFVQLSQPSLVGRVKLYAKDTPIFEEFGVQEQINNAMKSKVWLKSGGYIVINQTEALVAIDVNTGKYVGKTQRLEDTIVKTNVDAIKEIVRQIRLRDLGGIIVIDFIDMDERKNRQRVMQALEEALRSDRAPTKALQFNDFGLVAITRKRVKQPLEKALGCACPYCTGSGFVKSSQTVSLEILSEAKKMVGADALDRNTITLRVNPEVARYLKQPGVTIIAEIEELAKKPVMVKGDITLHQENFDIH